MTLLLASVTSKNIRPYCNTALYNLLLRQIVKTIDPPIISMRLRYAAFLTNVVDSGLQLLEQHAVFVILYI